jgi:hypothetical protein
MKPDLRVGIISTTSGSSEYYGAALRDGALLGIREFQQRQDCLRLIATVRDDAGDDSAAADAVSEFAHRDMVAILGPSDSHCASAAARTAGQLAIPLLSPGATAGYLTASPNPWFFRCVGSDDVRIRELADWLLAEHQGKPILVVHEQRDAASVGLDQPLLCGESGAKLLRDSIRDKGASTTVVEDIGFVRDQLGDREREAIQRAVQLLKPGAAVVLGRSVDEVTIADWVRRVNGDLPVYVVSPAKHLYNGKSRLDGMRAVTDSVLEAVASPRLAAFRTQYRLFRPDVPDAQLYHLSACFGYDASQLLCSALERLLGSDPDCFSRPIHEQRALVRRELQNTPRDRVGLVSDGGFTAQNELYIRPHRQELRNGEWGEVRHRSAVRDRVRRWRRRGQEFGGTAIRRTERHPLFLALVIITTIATAATLLVTILGLLKIWN